MSLGSAILRPQGLETPPGNTASREFDLLVELIEGLLKNPAATKAALEVAIEVFVPKLQGFLFQRQEKLRLSEGKLRNLFRPLSEVVMEFIGSMGEGIEETLPAALKLLRSIAGLLRSENISHLIREILHFAESDLGIDGEVLEDLFREVMEAIVEKLQDAVNQGDLSDEAMARFEMGTRVRSLEHMVLEELDWPALDKDVLVAAITAHWNSAGMDRLLSDLERLLTDLENLTEPLARLLETMLSLRLDVEISVGAKATPEMLRQVGAQARGYDRRRAARARSAGAQALRRKTHGPGPLRSAGAAANGSGVDEDGWEVTEGNATVDGGPVSFYASWLLQKEVRFTIDEDTSIIAPIGGISYRNLTPMQMEQMAFHTLWIVDMAETLLHFISAEKGDMATNLLNGFWDLFNTLNTPLNNVYKFFVPPWLQWAMVSPLSFTGSFERSRFGDNDPYWFFNLFLGDLAEVILYRRWTWMSRELFLSFFTLLNHDKERYATWKAAQEPALEQARARILEIEERIENGPVLTVAQKHDLDQEKDALETENRQLEFLMTQGNHNQFHGLCYAMSELHAMLIPLILSHTDRANYGFAGQGAPGAMIGKTIGGYLLAMAGGYLSLFIAYPMAKAWPDDGPGMGLIPWKERFLWNPRGGVWYESLGRAFWFILMLPVEFAMQGVYLYLFADGKTDDGTYCPIANLIPGTTGTFAGFAPAATSPYRLPWASGTMQECVQNPMGIWSHFPAGIQTYAVDYNHDAGTEVLCSRSGIITNFCDLVPNNTQNNAVNNAFGNNNAGAWNFIEVMHVFVFPPGATVPAGITPLAAVAQPAGITTFQDGTPIPAGTLFPPYWDGAGNPLPHMPNPVVPLHQSTAIFAGTPPAGTIPAGITPLVAGTSFAFLDPAHDRGMLGIPTGPAFSDGTPIPPGNVFAPNVALPAAPGTPFFPAATTTFAPGPAPGNNFSPVTVTYGIYGHGLAGFTSIPNFTFAPPPGSAAGTAAVVRPLAAGETRTMPGEPAGALTDLFGTTNPNQILGRLMPQGRPVLLSGDTGISAYNHLHVEVDVNSFGPWQAGTGIGFFPIPFVYSDVTHDMSHGFREAPARDGVPRAMTWYTSANTRVFP